MAYIIEPERKTEVTAEYEVAVVGGGIAGVAAALAAARKGAKTLLIEKQYCLGGLATLGLVTIYLPICDGAGRQVSFGLAEELLRLSIKHGAEARYPKSWLDEEHSVEERAAAERYEVQFDANVYAILLEKALEEENVDLLYGTSVCGVRRENGKVTSLIIENKSGRSAVKVKSVVDCSGDADVCFLAGEDTELYAQKNVLAAWYYSTDDAGRNKLKMLGFAELPESQKAKDDASLLVPVRFGGIDAVETSGMMQTGHGKILEDFLKNGGVSEKHSLTSIAGIPQLRMTRRVAGYSELALELDHKYVENSVGMISNWRKRGPVYEVPFDCLFGKKIKNIITAGRCISCTGDMWDISRVIPCCAVTGEAAGIAAAMTDDFASLDVKEVQAELVKNGVVLHFGDLA